MGYRLHLDCPSPEDFAQIFENYANNKDLPVEDGLIANVVKRYISESRDMRCSEPRDLIERAMDICRLRNHEYRLDQPIMDVAWRGYFGNASK
jgi:hypothetical protein